MLILKSSHGNGLALIFETFYLLVYMHVGISRYLFQSIIGYQKAACTLKNKVQAAFCVSVLCGQCFQQCLAQIVQPLRLGGGEAHGGDLAVVVAQAACILFGFWQQVDFVV